MIIWEICLIIMLMTPFDVGINDYCLMIIWRRPGDDCKGDIQNIFVLFHRVKVSLEMPDRKIF